MAFVFLLKYFFIEQISLLYLCNYIIVLILSKKTVVSIYIFVIYFDLLFQSTPTIYLNSTILFYFSFILLFYFILVLLFYISYIILFQLISVLLFISILLLYINYFKQYFCFHFFQDIVKLLLDNGANSHIKNLAGDCVRTMDDVCTEITSMIMKSEK